MKLTTLKKNRDFSMTYNRGKSFPGRHVVLIVLKRRYGGVRVGFTVSKKIGGAVQRNLVRRRLKEIVRPLIGSFSGSYYIIIVARRGIADEKYALLEKDVKRLLRKSGVLSEDADRSRG